MKSDDFKSLPGYKIVSEGIEDLSQGRITENALLVLIASPRLRSLGFDIIEPSNVDRPYEHLLYHKLATSYGDSAHSRYCSLIRLIVSFARAFVQVK